MNHQVMKVEGGDIVHRAQDVCPRARGVGESKYLRPTYHHHRPMVLLLKSTSWHTLAGLKRKYGE